MKINVKPSTDLAPVSVVMVSCGDMEASDIVTIAWTGTVNSEPPMLSISVRPSRYSYELIRKTGEFVVNLVTKELLPVCDGCGVVSGRSVDKFDKFSLTKEASEKVRAPRIAESPVALECVVKNTVELGTHVMFVAEIVNPIISVCLFPTVIWSLTCKIVMWRKGKLWEPTVFLSKKSSGGVRKKERRKSLSFFNQEYRPEFYRNFVCFLCRR